MVTATCDRVVVTQKVAKMKVLSGQSISLESKGVDSSLRLVFSVSGTNYPLMFYFLRFFREGTSHRFNFLCNLNVSAYNFDDSSKAFASVRIGVKSVSPIREVDHNGQVIGVSFSAGCTPVSEDIYPLSVEYHKCKFVLFKYIWDTWNNNDLVEGKNKDLLREPFSDTLEDLFEDLVDMKMLLPMFNPIAIQETTIKRLKKNSGARAGKKVAIRVANPKVKTSDILSEFLLLNVLVDDTVAFDAALFATSSMEL